MDGDATAIVGNHNDTAKSLNTDDLVAVIEECSTLIADKKVSATTFLKRSRCYYNLEQFEKALDDAKMAFDLQPNLADICIAAGRAAARLKRFEESYQFYKDGMKVDPKSQIITEDLKKLQELILSENEEKTTGSEPTYSAVRFCSQDPYPGDDKLLVFEQEILSKKHHIPGEQKTTSGKQFKPEDAKKHAAMTLRYRAGGNEQAALEQCSRAIAIDPLTAMYRQLRADILMGRGDINESLRDLFAIPKQSRTPEVWKLGGKLLRLLNLPVSAEFWFRKATRLSGATDEEAAMLFQKVRVGRLYGPMTEEYPISVDFTQFGRAIIAKEDIKEGETCFMDNPVLIGESLTFRKVKACSFCAMSLLKPEDYFGDALELLDDSLQQLVTEYWPDVTPILCKTCRRERYCSEACRDGSWDMYHQIICPARNDATKQLYGIADNNGYGKTDNGEWTEIWDGSYTPIILAKLWAMIIVQVKKQMKEDNVTSPTTEYWARAKAPFRRFIAFGSAHASDRMPYMIKVFRDIFRDCGDGVGIDITEAEFNGRYYQATCNLQTFSSYITPFQIFLTKLSSDLRGIRMLKYLEKKPPEAPFAGLFPLHACLNHACENNVEVSDGKGKDGTPCVCVIAKKDIKKGEELFTTYIDTTMPRRLRRAWLYKSFNFWCKCRRCQFEGEDPRTCTTCGVKAEKDKRFPSCGKCHKAWYCSVSCQKKAWKLGHKAICHQVHSCTMKTA